MNKKLISMITLCCIMLSACSDSSSVETTTIDETITVSTAESAAETTVEETVAETTAETAETTEETLPPYVHGEDGYFTLIDAGYGTPVKTQDMGTCWVTALATAMESNYLVRTGESITIDPHDLLDSVFNPDKPEGWFLSDNADPLNIGGWTWEVVEVLSNGWDSYIITDASMYEQDLDREIIQNGIRENGAMIISISDQLLRLYINYFDDICTYNVPSNRLDEPDHAVTIVGWDDNFPREYFKNEPSQDGAWLCQNTRGETWGRGGYYWVSYDMPFNEYGIVQISSEYDHVTAYDWGNEDSFSTGDTTTIANVFHDSGTLRAVGTYTADLNTNIHIEIRDTNMENVIYEQDAFFEINGYHSVVLDTPIDVTDYSIVLTFDAQAPAEGESFEAMDGENFVATINPGESFVLIDGEWVDMSSDNISELLGIDYVPNNCCIKAIY